MFLPFYSVPDAVSAWAFPKLLLSHGAESFVNRAIGQLLGSQANEVICVTGAHRDAVEKEAARMHNSSRLKLVHNPDFANGILGSIQTGIRALDARSESFLITLVDLPSLITADYDLLIESFRHSRPLLARYRNCGEPSHPAIFSRALEPEILQQAAQDQGLSFLFSAHAKAVWWLETDSRRGLNDVDTREEYLAHISP